MFVSYDKIIKCRLKEIGIVHLEKLDYVREFLQ
jgi:hypothetical protein